jgi:hypothetical protein
MESNMLAITTPAIDMLAVHKLAIDVLAVNPQPVLHGLGHLILVALGAIVVLGIFLLAKMRK